MQKQNIKQFLNSKLSTIWQHLDKKELNYISEKFCIYCKEKQISQNSKVDINNFISFAIELLCNNIEQRKKDQAALKNFKKDVFTADNIKTQNLIILRYLKKYLKKETQYYLTFKKKLLKTLDNEAIVECFDKKIHKLTRNNTAIYRITCGLLSKNKENLCIKPRVLRKFYTISFNELEDNIPSITKKEILSTLIVMAKNNGIEIINNFSSNIETLLESNKSTWVICNLTELLLIVNNSKAIHKIKEHINNKICNDIFIREFNANLIIKYQHKITAEDYRKFLHSISEDPSPFVRQALAFNLNILENEYFQKYLKKLLLAEAESPVKCSALNNTEKSFSLKERQDFILETIEKTIKTEINANVQIYALNTIATLLQPTDKLNYQKKWIEKFIILAENLHLNPDLDIATRRFAAHVREKLWCYSSTDAYALYNNIKSKINTNRKNKVIKFSKEEIEKYSDEIIGRVLAIIAQNDFSLDLKKDFRSYKMTIQPTFCFRWWRFFHELRTPSPEKRQTTKHTIGRLFKGTIRASSGIMAEQSETKVPGEPLFIDEEGNARPFLPLVDEFISVAEYGKKVQLFSSEGITTITPPKGYLQRYISELKITFKYKKLANLRNWQADISQEAPSAYIEQIRKLGFSVKLEPFTDRKEKKLDPEVNKFFVPAIMPIGFIQIINNLKVYFLSLYENTIYQLTIFTLLFILFITGRHYFLNLLIKKARRSIPLVIGGWGTRGKSGTERIKAALFSALGCNVVSKTTGCEAMFLYSPNYQKTHELFLFRPYDKATIWEQFNLLRTASKLDADVFLWECMALSSPYVKVLQQDWMEDDYSTITNTYPDHEDLQGPAGWNIAETMTNFIPKKSVLFTSEEQMYPILKVGAKKKETDLFTINKFDTFLITQDILDRFPYEEHPYNIALVLRMIKYLGVSRQFALKEMADNVVPDIGVLKKYKSGVINNRNIEFFSGMSANERFGCISNWLRMKFDQYSLDKNPDIYIATVVNNRADRIARSKVFAQILVEDLNADKHFLIGNNLEGLMGYIKEAWDEKMSNFSFSQKDENGEEIPPLNIFTAFAEKLRIPTTKEQIQNLLCVLLNTDRNNLKIIKNWNNADLLSKTIDNLEKGCIEEYIEFHKNNLEKYNKFIQLSETFKNSATNKVNEECKTFLWNCFKSKFVSINNYYASGNEILKIISDSTPPNFNTKLMALQNIKGTGLDFFYRWQTWENFSTLCDNALSLDPKVSEDALTEISQYEEFDILYVDRLKKVISTLKENNKNSKIISLLIKKIENKTENISYANYTSTEKKENNRMFSYLVNSVENFLDPGDAIRRRKKSDRIYRNLTAGRISNTNAAKKLHDLTKRQKGGWLRAKFKIK
jgi:gamma-polyglutamate synthase